MYSLNILYLEWGNKICSQSIILQVLLLRIITEVCDFYQCYTQFSSSSFLDQENVMWSDEAKIELLVMKSTYQGWRKKKTELL